MRQTRASQSSSSTIRPSKQKVRNRADVAKGLRDFYHKDSKNRMFAQIGKSVHLVTKFHAQTRFAQSGSTDSLSLGRALVRRCTRDVPHSLLTAQIDLQNGKCEITCGNLNYAKCQTRSETNSWSWTKSHFAFPDSFKLQSKFQRS